MGGSARHFVTEMGERLGLLRFSPIQVRMLAARATLARSDVAALPHRQSEGAWARPMFWKPLREALEGSRSEIWTEHHQSAVRSLVSMASWTQQKQLAHGIAASGFCRACHGGPGTLFPRRVHCPA
eukprot:5860541-Pyramimonas_sp.AAC.1